MIICQYNINKIDMDQAAKIHEHLTELFKEETIVTVPDGFTISEWADEYGKEELIKLRNMLDTFINSIEEKI